HVQLAQLLVNENRLKESHAPIDEALKLDSANPDALALKAYNLITMGRIGGAEEVLAAVLANHPKHLAAQVYLGMAKRERGQLAEAEAMLRKTMMANNRSPLALFELAYTLAAAKKENEAMRLLLQNIKTNPHYVPSYRALAGIYRQSERLDDAIKICLQ